MTKTWFPQRNTADAITATLKSFIHHIGYKLSKKTIEQDVEQHKEYPRLSFETIAAILKSWQIQSLVYQVAYQKISEMPMPSISLLNETIDGVKIGVPVVFYSVNEDSLTYIHPRKGWVHESHDSLKFKWCKTMISLISISSDGETDFDKRENEYAQEKLEHPERSILKNINGFMTEKECNYIIKLAEPLFKRSKVDGDTSIIDSRTSFSAFLPFSDDSILNQVRERASKLLGLPQQNFEHFQCVSYEVGQEYRSHYDTFDPLTKDGEIALVDGGQRKYTLLVYLNDDFEGGQTYFPKLDVLCTPTKGCAALFENTDQQGQLIKSSFHTGLPVSKGKKYAMNIWVRESETKHL